MNISKFLLHLAALAILLTSVTGVADARSFPAAITGAIVVSGGTQSCLGGPWGTTINNCSSTLSVDFPGASGIDTTGANSSWSVGVHRSSAGYQANCIAWSLNSDGSSYSNTGYYGSVYCSNSGGCSNYLALGSVYVPSDGYSYVTCSMVQNDVVDVIAVQ